jgi:hypothetical protein
MGDFSVAAQLGRFPALFKGQWWLVARQGGH